MTTPEHTCGWIGRLPSPDEPPQQCPQCLRRVEDFDVLRCRQGTPPRISPPGKVRRRCDHVGEKLTDAPCTCGAAVRVPVYRCQLLDRPCMPLGREKLADPDLKPLNCQTCDQWERADLTG